MFAILKIESSDTAIAIPCKDATTAAALISMFKGAFVVSNDRSCNYLASIRVTELRFTDEVYTWGEGETTVKVTVEV